MKWNFKGSALLVLCSTDMSENSYYGDTILQHLNRNGDSSSIQLSEFDQMRQDCSMSKIRLGKAGPIYSMEWSPIADEFCVVYGCEFRELKKKVFSYRLLFSYAIQSNGFQFKM